MASEPTVSRSRSGAAPGALSRPFTTDPVVHPTPMLATRNPAVRARMSGSRLALAALLARPPPSGPRPRSRSRFAQQGRQPIPCRRRPTRAGPPGERSRWSPTRSRWTGRTASSSSAAASTPSTRSSTWPGTLPGARRALPGCACPPATTRPGATRSSCRSSPAARATASMASRPTWSSMPPARTRWGRGGTWRVRARTPGTSGWIGTRRGTFPAGSRGRARGAVSRWSSARPPRCGCGSSTGFRTGRARRSIPGRSTPRAGCSSGISSRARSGAAANPSASNGKRPASRSRSATSRRCGGASASSRTPRRSPRASPTAPRSREPGNPRAPAGTEPDHSSRSGIGAPTREPLPAERWIHKPDEHDLLRPPGDVVALLQPIDHRLQRLVRFLVLKRLRDDRLRLLVRELTPRVVREHLDDRVVALLVRPEVTDVAGVHLLEQHGLVGAVLILAPGLDAAGLAAGERVGAQQVRSLDTGAERGLHRVHAGLGPAHDGGELHARERDEPRQVLLIVGLPLVLAHPDPGPDRVLVEVLHHQVLELPPHGLRHERVVQEASLAPEVGDRRLEHDTLHEREQHLRAPEGRPQERRGAGDRGAGGAGGRSGGMRENVCTRSPIEYRPPPFQRARSREVSASANVGRRVSSSIVGVAPCLSSMVLPKRLAVNAATVLSYTTPCWARSMAVSRPAPASDLTARSSERSRTAVTS